MKYSNPTQISFLMRQHSIQCRKCEKFMTDRLRSQYSSIEHNLALVIHSCQCSPIWGRLPRFRPISIISHVSLEGDLNLPHRKVAKTEISLIDTSKSWQLWWSNDLESFIILSTFYFQSTAWNNKYKTFHKYKSKCIIQSE